MKMHRMASTEQGSNEDQGIIVREDLKTRNHEWYKHVGKQLRKVRDIKSALILLAIRLCATDHDIPILYTSRSKYTGWKETDDPAVVHTTYGAEPRAEKPKAAQSGKSKRCLHGRDAGPAVWGSVVW